MWETMKQACGGEEFSILLLAFLVYYTQAMENVQCARKHQMDAKTVISIGRSFFINCSLLQVFKPRYFIQTVNPAPVSPNAQQTSVEFINVAPCERAVIQPNSFFKTSLGYAEVSGLNSNVSIKINSSYFSS